MSRLCKFLPVPSILSDKSRYPFAMATESKRISKQFNCLASCNLQQSSVWDVPKIIATTSDTKLKYATIILNCPITQKQEFIANMWNNAQVRMCVDGGVNQYNSYISFVPDGSQIYTPLKKPNLITGDFDSVSKELLQKYEHEGCKIVHTPDQNLTDFTKAIVELRKHCELNDIQVDYVIALGQVSARVDHFLGNVQTLFLVREKELFPDLKVYIITDDVISWLLPAGNHFINIPLETLQYQKSFCSLVPIGEPCLCVTSSGLRWNLDNQQLKFGELVSTSNRFNGSPTVTVHCSNPLLWSMRIPSVK